MPYGENGPIDSETTRRLRDLFAPNDDQIRAMHEHDHEDQVKQIIARLDAMYKVDDSPPKKGEQSELLETLHRNSESQSIRKAMALHR